MEEKMKIDLYTKVCLTVISLSLCAIAFKDTSIIKPSLASSDVVHKIAICNAQGDTCVSTDPRKGINMLTTYSLLLKDTYC